MQAKLTGREEQALADKPTNNPEAYDAYLRGLAFEDAAQRLRHYDLVEKAIDFYEQAVQLDPNFAIAWARLSRADALIYFNRDDDHSPSARRSETCFGECAETGAELAETLLALGYYQYWVLRDYGLPKPRSFASAKCCQAAARYQWPWP